MKQSKKKQKVFSISIIICTHDGGKTLLQCLESLNRQIYASDEVEILIIDNASINETKNIAQDFIKSSKFKCRYIFEPKLGLSVARNRGIREAGGEIVAFIDDDAIADKNWLKNFTFCFKSENVWAVGGKVVPKFEISPPTWLPEKKQLFPLTICDLGPKTKEVPHIVGTNMAFAKKIFKQLGRFRTDLGRKGASLLSGEEIDFCERITKSGGKIIYCPKAVVSHLVPKERLTRTFFRKRMFIEGVSLARKDKEGVISVTRIKSLFFQCPINLLIALFKFLIFSLKKDEKRSFSSFCDFLLNLGYCYGTIKST